MGGELHVQLAERGADAKRLHELTGLLRGSLLHLGVDEIPAPRVGEHFAHDVGARIEDLFADSRPDHGHLLHFACHGLNGESEDLFFVARNIRWDRLGSTAFSTDFARRRMQACVAGRNTHQERAGIAQCAAVADRCAAAAGDIPAAVSIN
jgi:hypothetical protein